MHIALLTDFGTRDPYVAAMKACSHRARPAIHDLSHDIAPFDVLGAAWFLSAIVRYWPEGRSSCASSIREWGRSGTSSRWRVRGACFWRRTTGC
jgi:hypothetical protein